MALPAMRSGARAGDSTAAVRAGTALCRYPLHRVQRADPGYGECAPPVLLGPLPDARRAPPLGDSAHRYANIARRVISFRENDHRREGPSRRHGEGPSPCRPQSIDVASATAQGSSVAGGSGASPVGAGDAALTVRLPAMLDHAVHRPLVQARTIA